jgi:hypothetical protein
MLGFRRATAGTELTNWQVVGERVLSFGRGDRGHVLFNTREEPVDVEVATSLAAGRYEDLLTGRQVDVDDNGRIALSLEPTSVVVLLAGSQ